jgi:hypothetical protein
VGTFAEKTAGGLIAIAIVVLGRWHPAGVLGLAAFGAASALQFALQAMGLSAPYQIFLALPYLFSWLAGFRSRSAGWKAPAQLVDEDERIAQRPGSGVLSSARSATIRSVPRPRPRSRRHHPIAPERSNAWPSICQPEGAYGADRSSQPPMPGCVRPARVGQERAGHLHFHHLAAEGGAGSRHSGDGTGREDVVVRIEPR